MTDLDFTRFEQFHEGVRISVSVPVDAALPETVEAFRSFLLAIGYSPESVREALDGEAPGTGGSR